MTTIRLPNPDTGLVSPLASPSRASPNISLPAVGVPNNLPDSQEQSSPRLEIPQISLPPRSSSVSPEINPDQDANQVMDSEPLDISTALLVWKSSNAKRQGVQRPQNGDSNRVSRKGSKSRCPADASVAEERDDDVISNVEGRTSEPKKRKKAEALVPTVLAFYPAAWQEIIQIAQCMLCLYLSNENGFPGKMELEPLLDRFLLAAIAKYRSSNAEADPPGGKFC